MTRVLAAPPFVIHIDGASRGNPGEASFGVHVEAPDGQVTGLYGYLGRATNNFAEYQALIHALKYALAQGATDVAVYSDSELVVKQIDGRYRVKHPDMLPLHREADKLANQALDLRASKLE